jgi:hypothetical protein
VLIQIASTIRTLSQKLIIKNIAAMNAAELQLIKRLWKSITRKKLYDLDKKDTVKSATLV